MLSRSRSVARGLLNASQGESLAITGRRKRRATHELLAEASRGEGTRRQNSRCTDFALGKRIWGRNLGIDDSPPGDPLGGLSRSSNVSRCGSVQNPSPPPLFAQVDN
ncbi:hypothetical protein BHE74_00021651 [Ensete ventricosum]|nr:hypothetical protein BHE74_00021651 [Ensete ventricosum]